MGPLLRLLRLILGKVLISWSFLTKNSFLAVKKLLLINGPNLNLLGTREPDKYGSVTLSQIEEGLNKFVSERGGVLTCFQSNHEGAIVDRIQEAAKEGIDAIIINPGAYTHTSVAIRDAFLSVNIPFCEVHLSNIFKREPFRHKSFLSDIAQGCLIGLGAKGYFLAAEALLDQRIE